MSEWMGISYETLTLWGVWVGSVAMFLTVFSSLYIAFYSQRTRVKIKHEKIGMALSLERIGLHSKENHPFNTELRIINAGNRIATICECGICFRKNYNVIKIYDPPKRVEIGETILCIVPFQDVLRGFRLGNEEEYGRLKFM